MKFYKKDDVAGYYHVNQYCISLPSDSDVFDENGLKTIDLSSDKERGKLSTFVHEYYHYVHNVSTVSGFMSILYYNHLLSEFWYSIDPVTGDCKSSVKQSGTSKEDTRKILQLCNALEGDDEPYTSVDIEDLSIMDIQDITERHLEVEINGHTAVRDIPILHIQISDSASEKDIVEFELGDYAIDEGIAYEIDRFVAANNEDGVSVAEDNSPAFPYFIIRKVSEYIVEDEMPIISRLACARMSTMSTEPGKLFIDLLKHYKEIKDNDNKEEEEIIELLWSNMKNGVRDMVNTLIMVEIPGLISQHKGRGLVAHSVNHLTSLIEKTIQFRLQNPFYDLIPFNKNILDKQKLEQFVNNFISCAVIQENEGEEDEIKRDFLFSFSSDQIKLNGFREIDFFRTIHAQVHYLYQHLSYTGFIDSGNSDDNKCPFYNCCDLPDRKKKSEICKNRPWNNYKENGENCWYGSAVASVIGKTDVIAIKRSDPIG